MTQNGRSQAKQTGQNIFQLGMSGKKWFITSLQWIELSMAVCTCVGGKHALLFYTTMVRNLSQTSEVCSLSKIIRGHAENNEASQK